MSTIAQAELDGTLDSQVQLIYEFWTAAVFPENFLNFKKLYHIEK